MTVELKPQPAEASVDPGCRSPEPTDAEALACLMLDAYRGSTDDEGETIEDAREEIRRLFGGDYGDFLPECSEVIERDAKIVAATLLTLWQGVPLVSFSMTSPAWKRSGLARAGLRRTMNRLLQRGNRQLQLFVTRGNDPAERLYESLGFREI